MTQYAELKAVRKCDFLLFFWTSGDQRAHHVQRGAIVRCQLGAGQMACQRFAMLALSHLVALGAIVRPFASVEIECHFPAIRVRGDATIAKAAGLPDVVMRCAGWQQIVFVVHVSVVGRVLVESNQPAQRR